MKRKLLSSLATLVLVIAGALSPVAGFFGTGETIRTAYAQATTTEEVTVKDDEDKQKSAELECGVNPACRTVKNYITAILEPTYPIAALSGFFLDYVLLGTISSNSYSENSGLGSIAVTGWKLIRDFTNLLFIFALFAVAFNLILNVNTSGGTGASNGFGLDPKRTIARILLMALLVNFSFFLSRSIIDISNQLGLVFFNKISVTGATDAVGSNLDSNNSGTENKGTLAYLYDFLGIKSISLSILANVDPQALVLNSVDGSEGTSVEILGFTAWGSYDWKTYIAMMQLAIISTLFNLFLAFIFISLGVTLMGRTLGLVFGIVLSPIAFVSFAIPSLENQPYIGFTNWFSEFAKLAVTAPILLFFMYLIIAFLKAPFISPDMSGFFATAALIVIKLSAIGGLLILARRVTKDLSGRAGQMASKIAVGVATTVAVVGATAATGGMSAVGALGRRYATNKGRELAANGISRVTGQDVEAIQQRMKGLKNFSAKGFAKETFGMLRKKAPESVQSVDRGIQSGIKAGRQFTSRDAQGRNVYERAEAMAASAEQRKKEAALRAEKIRMLDYKIEKLQKEFKNPNLDEAGRQAIREQTEQAKKEKWNVQNPASRTSTPPAPNQPPIGQTTAAQPTIPPPPPNPPVGGTGGPNLAPPPTSASVTNIGTQNVGTATPEQVKAAVEEIEKELRAIDEEAKKPEVIGNKNRTDELQAKYQALEQERRDANSGTVLPPRLKSIPSVPVGAPVRKTFGEGPSRKIDYTPFQQERILNKAIAGEAKAKAFQGATPAEIQRSKVSKLLSGITAAAPEPGNGKAPSYVPPVIIGAVEEKPVTIVDASGKPASKEPLSVPKPPVIIT